MKMSSTAAVICTLRIKLLFGMKIATKRTKDRIENIDPAISQNISKVTPVNLKYH